MATFTDLTKNQKAQYFAALEVVGRNGREEIQRWNSRVNEIEITSYLDSETKAGMVSNLDTAFGSLIADIFSELPTPDSIIEADTQVE